MSGVPGLELHGLGVADVQALLADKQLVGDAQAWLSLVDRYDGNSLALKIVGETIRQVFAADVEAFMREAVATYGTVFAGIRRLLDVQVERLSESERDVLTRMAIEREPISLATLAAHMEDGVDRRTVIEVLEALRRRSLVELVDRGATFTLQSMVLEYVTDRLVERVADEILHDEPVLLVALPLIKRTAKGH